MHFAFLRSFRLRVFILILLAGAIPCVLLGFVVISSYEDKAVNLKISDAQTQGVILSNHLTTYGYLSDTSSEIVNAELYQFAESNDGRIMIVDKNCRVVTDTYLLNQGRYLISNEIISCLRGENTTIADDENHYILMTIPIMDILPESVLNLESDTIPTPPKEPMVEGVLQISVSTESILTTKRQLSREAQTIEAGLLVLLVGMAFLLSKLMVRPFDKVTTEIQKVKAGFSNEEISVLNYLETQHISEAFNALLSRMKVIDDSRDEFVANVSHELKTPMTSMKVLADSILMQENVDNDMYREFLLDIANEIDRENKIITDLLSLVKLDKSATELLTIGETDINGMLELILKRLRPIAIKRDVELILECNRAVVAGIDEGKLTLAFSNLVENAIKYNNSHGWVKVKLDADHKFFYVDVADSGIGIPKEAGDHIYERFYRVDKSHSREIGGTGLGLSITKNAILMHRGILTYESREGEGTTFKVKIPLSYRNEQ